MLVHQLHQRCTFKRLQYAEVNKQKENELLLAKNDNNKLQEIIQTLHLENERLKKKKLMTLLMKMKT